ncbi:MAG: tripartite tricarboxylate transporter TctB family protein [Burkholderiales bacterium]
MENASKKAWTVRNGDRLSGGILLAFAAYATYEALQLGFGSLSRPGPGFYPTLVASLLGLLACAVVGTSLRSDSGRRPVSFTGRTIDILVTCVAIVIYAGVVERIGFLLCTFTLVLALLVAYGKVPWVRALLVAAAGTIVSYVIFTALGIPLPQGVLPL